MTDGDCFICRKQRGEFALAGGPIVEHELLVASHKWESPESMPEEVYLGHVFVETSRHAPAFADLTAEEAPRGGYDDVAALTARLAAAL